MKHFTLISLIAAALLFTACEEKTTTEIVTPKTDSEKAMDSLKEAAGHAKKAATEAASDAGTKMDEMVEAVKAKAAEVSETETLKTPTE